MDTHKIGVGDTLTPIGVQLKQKNNSGVLAVVDLTGMTVKFKMVSSAGVVIVAETANNVSVTAAITGKVQYDFQAADVDTVGVYYLWFTAYTGAERDTFPVGGRELRLVISGAV